MKIVDFFEKLLYFILSIIIIIVGGIISIIVFAGACVLSILDIIPISVEHGSIFFSGCIEFLKKFWNEQSILGIYLKNLNNFLKK